MEIFRKKTKAEHTNMIMLFEREIQEKRKRKRKRK
jgi:hypothetical protein